MANPEHRRILRQGIDAWNQWRKDNPRVYPDFNRADLSKEDFVGFNFGKAELIEADLSGANFYLADLRNADLSDANLMLTNFSGANLTRVNLNRTLISSTNFREANLSKATFEDTFLIGANFEGVKLVSTYLRDVDLMGINLSGANLKESNLYGADLSGANLSGANLTKVDMSTACLLNTNLDRAILTGALLWETQRTGWSIKDIVCKHVYWDKQAKEKTEYASGEFERLFAEQTKIRLFHKNGISPLEIATLPALIQHLEQQEGVTLRFRSIHEDAGGAVVELAIENSDNLTTEIVKSLQKKAEQAVAFKRKFLSEAKARQELQIRYDELSLWSGKQQQAFIASLKDSSAQGDTYIINGQAGAVGRKARAKRNTLKSTPVKKTRRKS
jgi:uncharacterized protein YjbI with pentapeptide repeats